MEDILQAKPVSAECSAAKSGVISAQDPSGYLARSCLALKTTHVLNRMSGAITGLCRWQVASGKFQFF